MSAAVSATLAGGQSCQIFGPMAGSPGCTRMAIATGRDEDADESHLPS
jgi:hypothetical protein